MSKTIGQEPKSKSNFDYLVNNLDTLPPRTPVSNLHQSYKKIINLNNP